MLEAKHLHLPQSSWDSLPDLGLSADGLASRQRRSLDEGARDLRTEGQVPSSQLDGELPRVEWGYSKRDAVESVLDSRGRGSGTRWKPPLFISRELLPKQGRKNMFNAMALMYDWNDKFLTPKWRVVTESSFPYYCSCDSNKAPETPLKKGTFFALTQTRCHKSFHLNAIASCWFYVEL